MGDAQGLGAPASSPEPQRLPAQGCDARMSEPTGETSIGSVTRVRTGREAVRPVARQTGSSRRPAAPRQRATAGRRSRLTSARSGLSVISTHCTRKPSCLERTARGCRVVAVDRGADLGERIIDAFGPVEDDRRRARASRRAPERRARAPPSAAAAAGAGARLLRPRRRSGGRARRARQCRCEARCAFTSASPAGSAEGVERATDRLQPARDAGAGSRLGDRPVVVRRRRTGAAATTRSCSASRCSLSAHELAGDRAA